MATGFVVKGKEELFANFREFSERRAAAAIATALTRTALDVKRGLLQQLPKVFDRPTPYTLNSLYTRPATAQRLQASVYFKDDAAASNQGTPATKYLMPEVTGGQRRTKRFEVALQAAGALPKGWFTVPGAGANIDRYGNLTAGQIIQILSQLRITMLSGFTRNMSFDARKAIAAQRRAGGRFFVVPPGVKTLAPGIYMRELIGRNITPVVIFVRQANYKARFDFDGISSQIAAERLPVQAEQAAKEQLARMLAKAGLA